MSFTLAFLVAAIISFLAFKREMLSVSGMIAATVVGGAVFGFGGWSASALLMMFFLSGSLLGKLNEPKGDRRDWKQVVCNGAIPAIAVTVIYFRHDLREEFTLLFLGALATATADTWATEIGIRFGRRTYNIFTFRETTKGLSGGVSVAGLAASIVASFAIASTSMVQFSQSDSLCGLVLVKVIPVITIAGTVGALLDSIIGATLQVKYKLLDGTISELSTEGGSRISGVRFIGNNATNLIATLWGGLLAVWLSGVL
ncbi:MAG: DUF92 domain-containing protein [bacterium]